MKACCTIAGLVIFILSAFMTGIAAAEPLCSSPVQTQSGMVQGLADEQTQTCVWKGIPYAASPVEELRWKAPQPAKPWYGVREAAKFGDKCMQKAWAGTRDLKKMKEGMSEDCLYLNIWRPAKATPGAWPVMVWIHGGGYVIGSSNIYNGGRMSETGDVIVVTINYRLGIFGYLAAPALRAEDPNKSTGNYGSLDQVAAIKWVHENIKNFGGDPGNVTIFGESAGGMSVCTMLAVPLNKGMFQRAIVESGSCEGTADLDKGYKQAEAVATSLGCGTNDISCMRGIDTLELANRGMDSLLKGVTWVPHHDGYMLTDTPLTMIRAGNYNKVPFLAGANRDEVDAVLIVRSALWNAPPFMYKRTIEDYLGLSGAEADNVIAMYPLKDYNKKPREAFGQMFSDAAMICPTYRGLASVAAQQDNTYFYRFDYDQMKYGGFIKALHSMEIPFVFGELQEGVYTKLYDEKNIGPANELSRTMMGYWTNFAKTGDPNGKGLPEWPLYKTDTRVIQILDTSVHSEQSCMDQRCTYWDQFFKNHTPLIESLGKPEKKK